MTNHKRDRGDGGIDSRGENRWRLRYRIDGKRYTKSVSGTKKKALTELRRLLQSGDDGTHIAPDKQTVAQYLTEWLSTDTNLSPRSVERYRQLAQHQIIPHLGSIVLQKLKRPQLKAWHSSLLKSGLHPQTIANAHRMLSRGLKRAVDDEILARNVATGMELPAIEHEEPEILQAEHFTRSRSSACQPECVAASCVGYNGAVSISIRARSRSNATWNRRTLAA